MEENSIDGTYIHISYDGRLSRSLSKCIPMHSDMDCHSQSYIVPFPPTHVHLLIYLMQENQELYVYTFRFVLYYSLC